MNKEYTTSEPTLIEIIKLLEHDEKWQKNIYDLLKAVKGGDSNEN